MDRRFLLVIAMSLLVALVLSSIFYQQITGRAATKDGTIPAHVERVEIPQSHVPLGAFSPEEEVLDRPLIGSILAEAAPADPAVRVEAMETEAHPIELMPPREAVVIRGGQKTSERVVAVSQP